MRYAAFIVAVAASTVSAYAYGNGTDYTTTEVVTSYTTFCAEPTEYVEAGHTYTVTEPTTLTITNCPCTLTKTYSTEAPVKTEHPVETKYPVETPIKSEYPVETGHPVETPVDTPTYGAPVATGTGVPPSYGNETTSAPSYTAPPSATGTDVFEGAASRATVAGGALAGVLGLVAYLL